MATVLTRPNSPRPPRSGPLVAGAMMLLALGCGRGGNGDLYERCLAAAERSPTPAEQMRDCEMRFKNVAVAQPSPAVVEETRPPPKATKPPPIVFLAGDATATVEACARLNGTVLDRPCAALKDVSSSTNLRAALSKLKDHGFLLSAYQFDCEPVCENHLRVVATDTDKNWKCFAVEEVLAAYGNRSISWVSACGITINSFGPYEPKFLDAADRFLCHHSAKAVQMTQGGELQYSLECQALLGLSANGRPKVEVRPPPGSAEIAAPQQAPGNAHARELDDDDDDDDEWDDGGDFCDRNICR